jgi:hypothetical protein
VLELLTSQQCRAAHAGLRAVAGQLDARLGAEPGRMKQGAASLAGPSRSSRAVETRHRWKPSRACAHTHAAATCWLSCPCASLVGPSAGAWRWGPVLTG